MMPQNMLTRVLLSVAIVAAASYDTVNAHQQAVTGRPTVSQQASPARPSAAQQQTISPRAAPNAAARPFRFKGNNVDRYSVIFKDGVAGPRGRGSRAADVAQSIAGQYGIRRITHVYRNIRNGFEAQMAESVARHVSEDPRVRYVEQETLGEASGSNETE